MNLGIEPPKGVLLFGPPGTGKTLCARAVANRTDACFVRVIGSELVQKYVGEVRGNPIISITIPKINSATRSHWYEFFVSFPSEFHGAIEWSKNYSKWLGVKKRASFSSMKSTPVAERDSTMEPVAITRCSVPCWR